MFQEINKKVDGKIQRVEENILQWIDEETKVLKENLDKDIHSIRSEVDTKNVELNAKVQATIHDLREEVIEKVAGGKRGVQFLCWGETWVGENKMEIGRNLFG